MHKEKTYPSCLEPSHTDLRRDPSLHETVVTVKCDGLEILDTAESYRKGRRKLGISLLKALTNPNNIWEEKTQLFSISSSCSSSFGEYLNLVGIADPGTNILSQ